MRVSRRWLNSYIELTPDLDDLQRQLTFSGIEVEAVHHYPALADSVITARIISSEAIPGTDHLKVCLVEHGGKDPVQVVCGAPNCRSGLISVLALPGSVLQDYEIKTTRLKGVESAGMLCSERELGISDNHAGIIELDADTPIGIPVNDIFGLPDTAFELEITPNRPDLLGYLGIARDLSASTGKPLILPELQSDVADTDPQAGLKLILEDAELCPRYTARLIKDVQVKDSPQWLKTALIKSGMRPINNIVDVTNYVMLETGHPLHAFDYHKLQPLTGDDPTPAIVVRRARNGEKFLALDGNEYQLDENDLVIGDGQVPSALAGVIGGRETAISETTTTIVLESAAFHPGSIRRTAYKHKITTDSAYRFERHLSPAVPPQASLRATELILQVAGGKVVNQLYDAYPEPVKTQYLGIRPERFELLIGFSLSSEEIKSYLEALGLNFHQYGSYREGLISDPNLIYCHHGEEEKAGITEFTHIECDHALYFTVPPYRVDLTREVDLIEELARLAGYDKAPQKTAVPQIMDRHAHQIRRRISDHLVRCGCYEVVNYSFTDPDQHALLAFDPIETGQRLIRLINPQSSNQAALRLSLIPNLLINMSHNLRQGERDLKLMEIGKLYLRNGDSYIEPLHLSALLTGKSHDEHWKMPSGDLDQYHLKGWAEGLLNNLQLPDYRIVKASRPYLIGSDSLSYQVGDTLCATIGRIIPRIAQAFDIDTTVLKQDIWLLDIEVENLIELTRGVKTEFVALPRYPSVTRDLSFVISQEVSYSEIAAAIKNVDVSLIKDVKAFDEYRGKQIPAGFRSLSLRLIVQDAEKTLTDERIDQLIASVIRMLTDKWQIKMR